MSFWCAVRQTVAYPHHSNKQMSLSSLQSNYAARVLGGRGLQPQPGLAVHTYNPKIQEAVVEGRQTKAHLGNLVRSCFNTELRGWGWGGG